MGCVPQCQRHWEATSAAEAMHATDENLLVIEDAEEDGMLPNKVLDPGVQLDDPGEHNTSPQDHPEVGNDCQAEGGNVHQPTDADPTCIVKDMYLGATTVVASAHSTFHTLYDEQMQTGKGNVHYPFAGDMEWGLAHWLHKTGISRACIDEFLKLDYVSNILSIGLLLSSNIDKNPGPATATLLQNRRCTYGSH